MKSLLVASLIESIALVLAVSLPLAGCSTMGGLGKDMQHLGRDLEKASGEPEPKPEAAGVPND